MVVRRTLVRTALACSLVLFACADDAAIAPPPPGPPTRDYDYPLDDELRLQHLQAKSTHNSYHVETEGNDLEAWMYSHVPLDQQLGEQGVRHIELDVRRDLTSGRFEVFHLPILDEQTRCRMFSDCLRAVALWSSGHPAHHPIVIQLEIKDTLPLGEEEAYFAALHAEILGEFEASHIITPDEVRGDAPSLHDALATDGWPTLGSLRGRVMFTLDDGGEIQRVYTYDRNGLDGRIIFAHSLPSDPFAAIAVLNDPVGGAADIAAALAANMLVRTRADADVSEVLAGNTSRREAALASGAQFVTTDFPEPVSAHDYWLDIPAGTPSRCNPVTAPPSCFSEALENPYDIANP